MRADIKHYQKVRISWQGSNTVGRAEYKDKIKHYQKVRISHQGSNTTYMR